MGESAMRVSCPRGIHFSAASHSAQTATFGGCPPPLMMWECEDGTPVTYQRGAASSGILPLVLLAECTLCVIGRVVPSRSGLQQRAPCGVVGGAGGIRTEEP